MQELVDYKYLEIKVLASNGSRDCPNPNSALHNTIEMHLFIFFELNTVMIATQDCSRRMVQLASRSWKSGHKRCYLVLLCWSRREDARLRRSSPVAMKVL